MEEVVLKEILNIVIDIKEEQKEIKKILDEIKEEQEVIKQKINDVQTEERFMRFQLKNLIEEQSDTKDIVETIIVKICNINKRLTNLEKK